MEQMFLVGMLKHVEKREVIQDPQGFTESKFCLTSLTLFYDGVTTLVDERKAMDAINPFLYFWVLWDFHQIQWMRKEMWQVLTGPDYSTAERSEYTHDT